MPRPLCTKITVVSIRPPDDSREVLYFTDELFFLPRLESPRRPIGAPSKIYKRLGPKSATKNLLRCFAHPALMFTGGQPSKSAKRSIWGSLLNPDESGLLGARKITQKRIVGFCWNLIRWCAISLRRPPSSSTSTTTGFHNYMPEDKF